MGNTEEKLTASEDVASAEHERVDLLQLRADILARILWIMLPLATITAMFSAIVEVRAGRPLLAGVYLLLLAMLLLAAAAKRVAYTVRASMLLGILYLFSLSELWMFGVTGMADVTLFMFVLLAGVLFSLRVGVVALCASLAMIAVIASLYLGGGMSTASTAQDASLSLNTWISATLTFSLLAASGLSVVTLLCQRLERSLQLSQELVGNLRREVAERKQAEKALEKSVERWKSFDLHSTEGVFRIDLAVPVRIDLPHEEIVGLINKHAVVGEANESSARMHGLARQDIIGHPATDFAPNVGARAVLILNEEGYQVTNNEAVIIAKDGKKIHLLESYHGIVKKGHLVSLWGAQSDITERKRAEEASCKNAALLQILMDNIPDSIYFKDEHLRFTRVNKGFARHLGLSSPDEAIGKDDSCFFTPEHANSAGRQERRIIETSEPLIDFLEEERSLDGRIRWVSTTQAPIFDVNGKFSSLVGISRDITERKLLEEDLSKVARGISAISGENFFTQVVQFLAETLEVKYALVGKIIQGETDRVATTAVIAEGIIQENFVYDLAGTPCKDVATQGACVFQSDLQSCYPEDQLFLDMNVTAYAAVPLRSSTGSVLGILAVMHTDPFKNVSRVSSMLEILAGRTASELERAQNESDLNRLKQAVEQAAESVVITDSEAIIQYVNPAFEETTGYTRNEAIGQNPRILKSGQQDSAFYKTMWGTLLHGAAWSGKFVNKKKDGTHYRVEANISPVQDRSGKTVSYISIQRDVTHERELEQQLRQAQKMKSVGTLAGGIAHDFNNILQAILGFTHIAQQNTEGNTELLSQCLREIDAGGQRAADLVTQILTFSRKSEVDFEPLTLQILIEDALRFLRSSIPTTINIEAKIDTNCGPVMANATQIHQVVTNLCTNAMHAMSENGGVLSVSLKPRSIDSLMETLSGPLEPGAYIELLVGDTGTGILPHLFDRLLDPFFTTKEVGKGTGLGLPMVHGIVKEMGGGLSIDSKVDEGTTVRILFPVLLENEAVEKRDEAPQLTISSGHILHVDDEESITALCALLLEKHGFTVQSFNDVDTALKAVQSNTEKYDVAIFDYTMPGKTGFELAWDFHSLIPALPVILATGLLEESKLEQSKPPNIVEIIRKPFSVNALVAAINRAL